MGLYSTAFIAGFVGELEKKGYPLWLAPTAVGAGLGGLTGLGYEYLTAKDDPEYLRAGLTGAGVGGLAGLGVHHLKEFLESSEYKPPSSTVKTTPQKNTVKVLSKKPPSVRRLYPSYENVLDEMANKYFRVPKGMKGPRRHLRKRFDEYIKGLFDYLTGTKKLEGNALWEAIEKEVKEHAHQ